MANMVAPFAAEAGSGPAQPEFLGYENPGATDMVNLTTGDFTYQLPLLDIPGPERSFSLPLTYRAGIRLEQEASWVGLGWSLNPGAIVRTVNGYPDDASGEPLVNSYKRMYDRGWSGGLPGLFTLGWSAVSGHSGSVDLLGLASVGWSGGHISSGDVIGIKYEGEGKGIDPIRMAIAVATIASFGSAGGAAAAANASKAAAIGAKVGIEMGQQVAFGVAATLFLGRSSGTASSLTPVQRAEDPGAGSTNYWYYHDYELTEDMYGSLYFGRMSQQTSPASGVAMPQLQDENGTAVPRRSYIRPSGPYATFSYRPSPTQVTQGGVGADYYQYVDPGDGEWPYWNSSKRPISIAHDAFSVMGDGISGNIRPMRLDVGSLSYPRAGTEIHHQLCEVPFLNDYKVGFRYENSITNSYDELAYQPATGHDPSGFDVVSPGPGLSATLKLEDPLFQTSSRTPATRKGLYDNSNGQRRLVQGRHIDWYSNEEIVAMYAASSNGTPSKRFIEFEHPRTEYPALYNGTTNTAVTVYPWVWTSTGWQNNIPKPAFNPYRRLAHQTGIGAFAVTAEDGTTYHYSLPVNQYRQHSWSKNLRPVSTNPWVNCVNCNDPEDGIGHSILGGQPDKTSYAAAWLLTAVTSADYIDRNQNGVVDEEDWGGWVKLSYGRFSSQYKWQQPYIGTTRSMDGDMESYTQGFKETYYLNSISTRTHTAVFIKDIRHDGRGHYAPGAPPSVMRLGMIGDEQTPSSSLKLDQIVLLTNEDYQRLSTENGIRDPNDMTSPTIPAFTTNTNDNCHDAGLGNPGWNTQELANLDSYEKVFDVHDVEADARIAAFIRQRALKRIKFNYSYRLCPNTVNSFPDATHPPSMNPASATVGRSGKLTLESLSMYGPASSVLGESKLMPDFVFHYGANPAYSINKWDGFGMYCRDCSDVPNARYHKPSEDAVTAAEDGAAWSLREVISPLGAKTITEYERDQYGYISQNGKMVKMTFANDNCTTILNKPDNFSGDLRDYLSTDPNSTVNGPHFYVSGKARWGAKVIIYDDYGNPYSEDSVYCERIYDDEQISLNAVSASSIEIDIPPYMPSTCLPNVTFYPVRFSLTLDVRRPVYGGDIRVSRVYSEDGFGRGTTLDYLYVDEMERRGYNSTGVVALEPDWVKDPSQKNYNFDYPQTPVLYKQTMVRRGGNTGTNWDTQETYQFYTPATNMVQLYAPPATIQGDVELRYYNQIVNLGKIGQVRSVKKANRRGEVEFETAFEYSNNLPNNYDFPQGRFTEGAMINDLLANRYYCLNRTTKTYLPTVVSAIVTKARGLETRVTNDSYDFYSGQVLSTTTTSSTGASFKTWQVPAYALTRQNTQGQNEPVYEAMGAKGDNPSNRNMLAQPGMSYIYKVLSGAPATGPDLRAVFSASVQTWEDNWDYRRWLASSNVGSVNSERGRYVSLPPDPAAPVWRQYRSYVWNSPLLNPDGSYINFVPFNWNDINSQEPAWLKVSEARLYDKNSDLLESYSPASRQYLAKKTGYNNALTLASASNTKYTEIAYSGAEDEPVSRPSHSPYTTLDHYGGEVTSGSSRSDEFSHTGKYSIKVPGDGSSVGFRYSVYPYLDGWANSTATPHAPRKYRASVWVRSQSGNVPTGQLFVRYGIVSSTSPYDPVGEVTPPVTATSQPTLKAGSWYLLNLYFTLPDAATQQNKRKLVVGCNNPTGGEAVYFDDFRVQPVDAPMTAYVYDPHTWQPTYVLDNDNLFTRTEYDHAGQVKRVYREVLDQPERPGGQRLVSEKEYNYRRMREPNWLRTGNYQCQTISGTQIRNGKAIWEEVDINPLSSTPVASRTRQSDPEPCPYCN